MSITLLMAVASRSLGQYLVDTGNITPEQLEWGLARESESGTPLAGVLLSHHLVTEADVLGGAAAQLGVPFIDFCRTPPQPSMARYLGSDVARQVGAVAVGLDGTALVVALPDPTDKQVLALLAEQTGMAIRPALAAATDIDAALDVLYPASEPPSPPSHTGSGDLDALLRRVVELGGSDLHLTAGLAPAVRIDGEISALPGFPSFSSEAIEGLAQAMLTDAQRARFAEDLELDISHQIPEVGRFLSLIHI